VFGLALVTTAIGHGRLAADQIDLSPRQQWRKVVILSSGRGCVFAAAGRIIDPK
jgi:hypothetical protein